MPDYQCDMLFHGLRVLVGADVVDVNRLWYMYESEFREGGQDKSQLYGKGFTLYGLLNDDKNIDRVDIEAKIRTRFYDLIIFGSIWRHRSMIEHVLDNYRNNEIVFVDGEDSTTVFSPLVGRGVYFKRELTCYDKVILPINFAIPLERIGVVRREKIRALALADPMNKDTYIYDREEDYYGDYAESLFGATVKKFGWDCLRHYEILANSCVPYFRGIENCPHMTTTALPKFELWSVGKMLEERGEEYFMAGAGRDLWLATHRKVDEAFRRNCTTVALAKYVLDAVSWFSGTSQVPWLRVGTTAQRACFGNDRCS